MVKQDQTYKLLLVKLGSVDSKTLQSAIEGLPIKVVYVYSQEENLRIVDTGVKV